MKCTMKDVQSATVVFGDFRAKSQVWHKATNRRSPFTAITFSISSGFFTYACIRCICSALNTRMARLLLVLAPPLSRRYRGTTFSHIEWISQSLRIRVISRHSVISCYLDKRPRSQLTQSLSVFVMLLRTNRIYENFCLSNILCKSDRQCRLPFNCK